MRLLPRLGLLLALLWPALLLAAGPLETVRDTTDRILAEIAHQRPQLQRQPELIYPLVERIVLPQFDFVRMSRLVLGRNWLRADAQQRDAFVAAFRAMLVRTYANALLNYSNQEIHYRPLKLAHDAKRAVVTALVSEPGGLPIGISYRLIREGERWLVYDVSIDNVSLVSNYRSSFQSQVRRYGLDGLIERMQRLDAQRREAADGGDRQG